MTSIRGQHVSAAAHAGEPDALALVDEYSVNVAIGLVGLANIFDPGVIAIAGGLVNDGDLFLDPIRRHFLGHIEGADYRPDPGDRARSAGRACRGDRCGDPRTRRAGSRDMTSRT